MYESPIQTMMSDISEQIVKEQEDQFMYQFRQAIGYNIDKDELIKALQYDRDQYQKGYADALAESITKNDLVDYRRAFKIACDLLSGSVLYGIDSDKIFELMMDKDGVVSNGSYEEYILNHLQELDHGEYAIEPTTKNNLAVDSNTEGIPFKDVVENLGITAEDIENADDLEFSVEPFIYPKNEQAVLDAHRRMIESGDPVAFRKEVEVLPPVYPDLHNTCAPTCTDAISRQAAINEVSFGITYAKAVNDSDGVKELFKESNDELKKAIKRIEELPPVSPTRPKGYWIYENDKEHGHCSECGTKEDLVDGKIRNYCRVCGADMRGSEVDQ